MSIRMAACSSHAMESMNYLIGMATGVLITLLVVISVEGIKDQADGVSSNNPYLEGYIGVYTPFDILWIDPYSLSVTTENDTMKMVFEDIAQLSDWVEHVTANQVMISDELPTETYVRWVYNETNTPAFMKAYWYDATGTRWERFHLSPDPTNYPSYRIAELKPMRLAERR